MTQVTVQVGGARNPQPRTSTPAKSSARAQPAWEAVSPAPEAPPSKVGGGEVT